ncbi:MAG: AMP-binding protein [Porticoccaceae bacterium]|nr:AMP-binding protein [Porticoccaceae bacterium]
MTSLLFDKIEAEGHAPVVSDGSRTLDYGELYRHSLTLAEQLKAMEARTVASTLDNGILWLVVDLACQLADLPLLPVPGFFSPDQQQHVLAQAGVDTLIYQPGDRQLPAQWRHLASPFGVAIARNHSSTTALLPADTGKITYTSGSTGTPKGVCLSNVQLIRQAESLANAIGIPQLGGRLRHLSLLPLGVLLENVGGAYTTLISGGTLLVPALAEIGLKGSSSLHTPTLLGAISRFRPHTLILMPQMLAALVAAGEAGWEAPDSLFFVAVGGSKVAPSLLAKARDQGLPVYEGYGLSECASVVSLNTPTASLMGSAGRPLPHLKVEIRDAEVHVSGNPFLGYVDDPDSWNPGAIATGDLGSVDKSGFLHLYGRRKNLLITSYGRNISPEWIETELTDNGLIREAIVFGDARPFPVVLLHTDSMTSNEAISHAIEQCNQRLPDYARIRHWLRLPQPLADYPGLITSTGKPRREAIAQHFSAQLDTLYHSPLEA